jgi:ArsR family transcriptional regulator, arsenate/arsenite/antimonite-responsive transcriptional repressor
MHKCAYGGIGMYSVVKAIKALSDDTRLRIINLLMVKECCGCEVVQALGISQTRASRNLTILHDAGFLKLRKEGLWSLYSLDKEEMPEYLSKLVEAVKLALVTNKVAAQDKEQLKTATRTGLNCVQKANGVCSAGLKV